VLTLSCNF